MAQKTQETANESRYHADVELDIEKAYGFIGDGKYAHARHALSRAQRRLNAIRGLPAAETDASP